MQMAQTTWFCKKVRKDSGKKKDFFFLFFFSFVCLFVGSIREATVQKLTERVLDDQLSSTHFVSVFMATCRYWLKPMDLFCYLVDAWNSAPMEVDVSSKQVRLLLILRLWITHHFADFYDNHLLAKHVLHFIHTRLTNPIFQKFVDKEKK